ncbi:hypothetical protein SLE2022_109470 [Rubroshorea leprosula]
MSQGHFLLSTFLLLFLYFAIINHSSSARFLGNASPSHNHNHHKITFLMKDVLDATTQPPPRPATTKVTDQIPFSKPLGVLPPSRGIPIPDSNPSLQATGFSSQTLDVSNIGLYFPARAALQELESGAVIVIDENLFDVGSGSSSTAVGRAQGVYVANSEDGRSHMMAMTAYFPGTGFKDGLRFFGVHRKDVNESHVAVIGGNGKYVGANGYATVKTVNLGSNGLLLFNVYLS